MKIETSKTFIKTTVAVMPVQLPVRAMRCLSQAELHACCDDDLTQRTTSTHGAAQQLPFCVDGCLSLEYASPYAYPYGFTIMSHDAPFRRLLCTIPSLFLMSRLVISCLIAS